MFFLVQTIVGAPQTLFSEAEPIFCTSETIFSITEKTVGDISWRPLGNREDRTVSKNSRTFAVFEVLAFQFCCLFAKIFLHADVTNGLLLELI